MRKKIVYVDLDNTMVKFDSGVKKCSPEVLAQYAHDEKGKPHYDDIPGIFSLMDEIDDAADGFKFLAQHFDTYILSTAPWENPTAWSDKLEWVKKHLKEDAYKRLILSHHKDLNRGDYLIDDSTNNGAAEFQGRLIRFGSPEFPNWKAVIQFFKDTELDSNKES